MAHDWQADFEQHVHEHQSMVGFEHLAGPVDGEGLNRMVEQKLGPDWQRMVRETRGHGRDRTPIHVRPEGAKMGLFVVDLDGQELDVVEAAVDPDHLNQSVSRYEDHHEEWQWDRQESD